MYNKTLSDINNELEVDDVVIKAENNNLENMLYYRDEGNMNIVVSLFAQENDERRVIRFKKIPVDNDIKSNDSDLMSFIRFEELLQKYFDNADRFTVVPKIVFLDVDVHALNSFLMRDRPAARRNKIIGSNYGLLYRDVAFLPREIYMGKTINGEFRDSPTICIEIKAKQGFLMCDADDDAFSVKKCRYCYFQYLKLKNRRIERVSNYCPIDLFAGKAERMNRALKGLIENPQNNLKIFQDGKMVYNEYTSDMSSLRRVLLNLFPDTLSAEKQELLFVNLIRKILMKDFRSCDSAVDVCPINHDPESIHMRQCVDDPPPPLPANCILNSILKTQKLVSDNFSNMEILDKFDEPIHCDMSNQTTLQDYKIGSTALDCSIMITLRRINGHFDVRGNIIDKNHHVTINESTAGHSQHFIVNGTIVDLDMKKDSIAHFRKYKKQFQESKLAYFDFMENRKIKFHDL